MNQYTIYCTAEQTKKALEFDAPMMLFWEDIKENYDMPYCEISPRENELGIMCNYVVMPTAEQMIGWLEGQGINIAICICADGTYYNFYHKGLMKYYKTRKEATFAAIDVALDYLEKTTE